MHLVQVTTKLLKRKAHEIKPVNLCGWGSGWWRGYCSCEAQGPNLLLTTSERQGPPLYWPPKGSILGRKSCPRTGCPETVWISQVIYPNFPNQCINPYQPCLTDLWASWNCPVAGCLSPPLEACFLFLATGFNKNEHWVFRQRAWAWIINCSTTY